MPGQPAPLEVRFWSKVSKRGPAECWLWSGAINGSGYGMILTRRDGRHFMDRAHRVSFALANGSIPPDGVILHSCDNPPCVNPAHLVLGTQAENLADMRSKGRARIVGEKNGMARLTARDVREIRRRRAAGEGVDLLARAFGIAAAYVYQLAERRAWRHIA